MRLLQHGGHDRECSDRRRLRSQDARTQADWFPSFGIQQCGFFRRPSAFGTNCKPDRWNVISRSSHQIPQGLSQIFSPLLFRKYEAGRCAGSRAATLKALHLRLPGHRIAVIAPPPHARSAASVPPASPPPWQVLFRSSRNHRNNRVHSQFRSLLDSPLHPIEFENGEQERDR